jgi:tRNA(Ile)-lysidine synthetase-like protein
MNDILAFYKDWITNDNYWFSKNINIDNYLTTTYEKLLNYEYNELLINNKELYFIHFIIIYDQLPRHIFRNTYSNHIILYFLNKAIDIINNQAGHYDYNINNLTDIEWIFYMLPLRHTNDKNNILFVLKEAWNRYNKYNSTIIKKFIIATYKKANFKENILNNEIISFHYNKNVLEYYSQNNIITKFEDIGNFNFNINIINNYTIIISLSGGVDSMVCLINCIFKYPQINWICIHINYKNRKESDDETCFIAFICYKYNIKLYVREINEINREMCKKNDMRDIYEEYTKKIRFNCYKSIYENTNNKPIVILGHNKDDCFENILTNITYETKYNNLKGMNEYSIQDNIIFIRPLLEIYKNDIYIFAKTNNIPYLKNSTPEWSQRGLIRNNIIPVLNNWDKRSINGLLKLSSIVEELYSTIDININIFVSKFIIYKNTINQKTNKKCDYYKITLKLSDLNLDKIFWKLVIYKLINFNLSNKSVINLIDRLKLWIIKYEKHDINKITSIIISKNITFNIYKSNINNDLIILLYN